MNFFYKTKGTVSVFLVIILVPMITVCSLFVDASRVKLAQSVVSSSGDLALNTVLTQYDQDLNEYYGMLASCQSIEEFLKTIEDYFTVSLVSQGVDTTDAANYANKIKGLFTEDEEISDLLGISVEDSSFSISPVDNGSLTNPALVKAQIVEFMKYRSPINAAVDLFTSLKSVETEVENMADEAEMIDTKNEFYETESELLDAAYKAYKEIKEYTDIGITKIYISNMTENMNKYESQYKTIHNKMVYDLYNTSGKTVFAEKTITVNPTLSSPHSDTKQATAGKLKNYVNNTAIAIQDYLQAKEKLVNACNSIAYSSDTYNTQYWVQMAEILNNNNIYSNYVNKANSLCKNIAILENAMEYGEEGALETSYVLTNYTNVNAAGTATIQAHCDKLITQFNSLKTDFTEASGVYTTISSRLASISNAAVNGTSSKDLDGTISTSSTDSFIKGIYDEINDYYDTIAKAYDEVDDAVSKLKKLKKLVEEYQEDFKDWKKAANKANLDDSNLATTDRAEIQKLEEENLLKNVSVESIDKLIERLNNIKSLLGSLKTGIDEYKYNGTSVRKIDSYSAAKNKSGISDSGITTTKSGLRSYADSSFKFTNSTSMHNVTDNNNPDLTVKEPGLYTWLDKQFKDYDDESSSSKSAKSKYKEYKKEADTQASGTDEPQSGSGQPNISEAANLPSNGNSLSGTTADKSGKLSKVSSFVSSLFKDFSGSLNGVGTTIRDDLYVTDYIMSMFSYDTYEREGKYNLALADSREVDLSNYNTVYANYNTAWTAEALTKTYNKSLTNKMINSTKCYSYGNEVEYILYGKTNSENKTKTYGNIFMLRFAFNIAPVFQLYWSNTSDEGRMVGEIAAAISSATSGIIPEALVKLAICIGITAAEAGTDVQYLKAGIGVKLIKKKDELFISFSSSGGDGISGTIESKSEKSTLGNEFPCFQYSDYLSLFLVIDLLSSSKANAIYLRTADVIQCNMQKATNQPGFLLSNSQVYYQISTTIKVKPLLLGLPINTDEEGNLYDISKWNTFTYTAIRGY